MKTVTISSAATVRFIPSAFHPVGDRGIHVGERDTGDEREQNVVQQPQARREHEKRNEPKPEMAPVHHRVVPLPRTFT